MSVCLAGAFALVDLISLSISLNRFSSIELLRTLIYLTFSFFLLLSGPNLIL